MGESKPDSNIGNYVYERRKVGLTSSRPINRAKGIVLIEKS